MSIIEEALNRLDSDKQAAATEDGSSPSTPYAENPADMVHAVIPASGGGTWRRMWFVLFFLLFVLMCGTIGVYLFVAQQQSGELGNGLAGRPVRSAPNPMGAQVAIVDVDPVASQSTATVASPEAAAQGTETPIPVVSTLDGSVPDKTPAETVSSPLSSRQDAVSAKEEPPKDKESVPASQTRISAEASIATAAPIDMPPAEKQAPPTVANQVPSVPIAREAVRLPEMTDSGKQDSADFLASSAVVPAREDTEVAEEQPVYSDQGEDRMQRIRNHVQLGRFSEAVALLEPMFRRSPRSWEPWFWMGTAHLGLHNFKQAERFLDGALNRAGRYPQVWIQRAIVAQQQGDHSQALHFLREAKHLDPDLPEVHLNIGYTFDAMENFQAASQSYQTFLDLTADDSAYAGQRRKIAERLRIIAP